jgi:hypothetical protein
MSRVLLAIALTLLLQACDCICWTHEGVSKIPQDCTCKVK